VARRPFELVNSLPIRIRETRRLDAEFSQILAEVESSGAKATCGYGSTLAFLEDVAQILFAEQAHASVPEKSAFARS
jgi:hypothetical protein